MKSKLTSNLGLKLISLLFAFALWLVVNNMDNPSILATYSNIPVTLLNTEMITESGQVYEVLDATDVIERVTVRAPRSVINALNENNIIATADVSELSSLDTITIKLSTNVYSNQVESMTGSIDTVKLNIENKRTKTLSLRATVSGTVADGYLIGDITPEQNLVRISGPESLINQITRAAVDVDVTDSTSDIGTSAEIRLYDAEDNLIQDSRITQNVKSVIVKVDIYQTKEVPITYAVTGTAADGYRASGEVTSTRETVVLAGKSSVLSAVSAVEIPEEVLDISGYEENLVADIDIRDYLPEGVFLADDTQRTVEITVYIQPEVSKNLELTFESISVTNIPEGFRATIGGLDETFEIGVRGLSSDISAIRASDLRPVVDISRWMEEESMTEAADGYYQVEVDFGLPENVSLEEPVMVTLHLSLIEE